MNTFIIDVFDDSWGDMKPVQKKRVCHTFADAKSLVVATVDEAVKDFMKYGFEFRVRTLTDDDFKTRGYRVALEWCADGKLAPLDDSIIEGQGFQNSVIITAHELVSK